MATCKICGSEIRLTDYTCPKCGAAIDAGIENSKIMDESTIEKQKEETLDIKNEKIESVKIDADIQQIPLKKKSKKKVLLIAIPVAVIILLSVFLFIIPSIKRSKAKDYISEEKYNEAIEILEGIKWFRDSEDLLTEANNGVKYKKGVEFLEKEEYSDAIDVFETLGDFKDSENLLTEANNGATYKQGIKFLEKEKYSDAIEIFKTLGDFKDSENLLTEANNGVTYKKGVEFLEKEEYSEAIEIFKTLGDFKDSENLLTEANNGATYKQGVEFLEKEEYSDAIGVFVTLGDFKDSENLLTEANNGATYKQGVEFLEKEEYSDAIEMFDKIKGYKDSDSLLYDAKLYLKYKQNRVVDAYIDTDSYAYLPLIDGNTYKIKEKVNSALLSKGRNAIAYIDTNKNLFIRDVEQESDVKVAKDVSEILLLCDNSVLYRDSNDEMHKFLFRSSSTIDFYTTHYKASENGEYIAFFGSNKVCIMNEASRDKKSLTSVGDCDWMGMRFVSNDGKTVIWMEWSDLNPEIENVYCYKNGKKFKVGTYENDDHNTRVISNASGSFQIVYDLYSEFIYIVTEDNSIIKIRVEDFWEYDIYTENDDIKYDESSSFSGIYVCIHNYLYDEYDKVYYIDSKGNKEKILSDVKSYVISDGVIYYHAYSEYCICDH